MIDNEPSVMSDEELALLSVAGSLDSFEELLRRYEAHVYRFVRQRCGNPNDAKDLTQASFVSAFRKLRQFTPRRSFRSWLFAIARNKTIDFLRARRVHEEVDPDRLVDTSNPAEALADHEEACHLWTLAKRGLSAEQFDTLWLRYQEDLSIREIALTLHRTETLVKVNLFRARQKLAALLPASATRLASTVRPTRSAVDSGAHSFLRIQHQPIMTP